jgi:hypothetical protein
MKPILLLRRRDDRLEHRWRFASDIGDLRLIKT